MKPQPQVGFSMQVALRERAERERVDREAMGYIAVALRGERVVIDPLPEDATEGEEIHHRRVVGAIARRIRDDSKFSTLRPSGSARDYDDTLSFWVSHGSDGSATVVA